MFSRTIKFQSGKRKIVVEEEVIEDVIDAKAPKPDEESKLSQYAKSTNSDKIFMKADKNKIKENAKKSILKNLVKLPSSKSSESTSKEQTKVSEKPMNGLQLLGSYSDSDSE